VSFLIIHSSAAEQLTHNNVPFFDGKTVKKFYDLTKKLTVSDGLTHRF
jgi:hypothetical protein